MKRWLHKLPGKNGNCNIQCWQLACCSLWRNFFGCKRFVREKWSGFWLVVVSPTDLVGSKMFSLKVTLLFHIFMGWCRGCNSAERHKGFSSRLWNFFFSFLLELPIITDVPHTCKIFYVFFSSWKHVRAIINILHRVYNTSLIPLQQVGFLLEAVIQVILICPEEITFKWDYSLEWQD